LPGKPGTRKLDPERVGEKFTKQMIRLHGLSDQ